MNLIGYFLKNILQRNAKSPENVKAIRKMRFSILIKASEMKATLLFKGEEIEIVSGGTDSFDTHVDGSLEALFKICLGQNYLLPLLTRKMKIGGNMLKLIPLLKLLRVQK